MKKLLAMVPLPLALLLRGVAAFRPEWVERVFSTGVYPWFAAPVSRLMGLFSVPVIEVGIVIFFIFMLYLLCKKRFFGILFACCLVASLFVGGWGLNYFRLPLEETMSLPVRASDPGELVALCEKLIRDAGARYTLPPDDPTASANEAMDAAAGRWPIPEGRFGAPKVALLSPLLSRLMIEGITSPFTLEALVNGGIPAVSLPFVACHEAAHVRGFAREEDANLVAYLACEASDDAFTRYSGSFSALLYVLDALRSTDYEAYLALRATIPQGVAEDMAAHAAYWAQYRDTKVAEVSARVNDAYLGAAGSGDQSGRSYGRVVDLLLGLERVEGRGL